MKKYFLLFFSILFYFPFNACTKTTDNNTNLVAQWQWMYSFGGIAAMKINAAPNIVVINIKSDSTYTYSENGVIKSNDRYKLTYTNANKAVINFINLNASKVWFEPNGEIYSIKNDTLMLTDYMISDGFTHYFQKIK